MPPPPTPASADPDKVRVLSAAARAEEGATDLIGAGLALAAWRNPEADLAWYGAHIKALAADVAKRAKPDADVTDAAAALAESLAYTYGYTGDAETYDDIQNADLIRVIDRRKGLPVALGLIYMAVARAQGWRAHGLGFPGHFLIALTAGGERAILDPFHGGVERGPADLRTLIKGVLGPGGELSPAHYAAVADRRVLVRLADNMRVRLADMGRVREALAVLNDMLLLMPDDPRLMRDQALLSVQVGQFGKAVETLSAMAGNPALDAQARHEAASLLQRVRSRLN